MNSYVEYKTSLVCPVCGEGVIRLEKRENSFCHVDKTEPYFTVTNIPTCTCCHRGFSIVIESDLRFTIREI